MTSILQQVQDHLDDKQAKEAFDLLVSALRDIGESLEAIKGAAKLAGLDDERMDALEDYIEVTDEWAEVMEEIGENAKEDDDDDVDAPDEA